MDFMPCTCLHFRRLAGYTGHRPGLISEAMCGRSYSYLTGFREDILQVTPPPHAQMAQWHAISYPRTDTRNSGSMHQESALSSEYHKTHGREALRFEPKRFLRNSEGAPRHIILGLDATKSNRPISAAASHDKVHCERHELDRFLCCMLWALTIATACAGEMVQQRPVLYHSQSEPNRTHAGIPRSRPIQICNSPREVSTHPLVSF